MALVGLGGFQGPLQAGQVLAKTQRGPDSPQRGHGPSGNSMVPTWATCIVSPAGALEELSQQRLSGDGIERKEEEEEREREKTTQNKTTASELAP